MLTMQMDRRFSASSPASAAADVDQLVFEPGVDHFGMERVHARTSAAARARGRCVEADWRLRSAAAHHQAWQALRSAIETPIIDRVLQERRDAAAAVARGEAPVAGPSLGGHAAAVDEAFRVLCRSASATGFAEAIMVGRTSGLVFLRYAHDKLMSVVEHKGRGEIRDRCTWRPATPVLERGFLSAIARGAVLIEVYDRALNTFTQAHRATGVAIPSA